MESQLKQNNSVNFSFPVQEKFLRMRNNIHTFTVWSCKKTFDLKMSKCLQNQSEGKF